jgi:hypothetical protein
MLRSYHCDVCEKDFETDQPISEVEAEMLELWGNLPLEERANACDDCFQMLGEMHDREDA